LYDPVSEAALVISSYPNSIGPTLASRIAEEVERHKQAGNAVDYIDISDSVVAAYTESASDIRVYIIATKSSIFMTFTPALELLDIHRKTVRQLLADFTEIAD
jgi:hypothetical protein